MRQTADDLRYNPFLPIRVGFIASNDEKYLESQHFNTWAQTKLLQKTSTYCKNKCEHQEDYKKKVE